MTRVPVNLLLPLVPSMKGISGSRGTTGTCLGACTRSLISPSPSTASQPMPPIATSAAARRKPTPSISMSVVSSGPSISSRSLPPSGGESIPPTCRCRISSARSVAVGWSVSEGAACTASTSCAAKPHASTSTRATPPSSRLLPAPSEICAGLIGARGSNSATSCGVRRRASCPSSTRPGVSKSERPLRQRTRTGSSVVPGRCDAVSSRGPVWRASAAFSPLLSGRSAAASMSSSSSSSSKSPSCAPGRSASASSARDTPPLAPTTRFCFLFVFGEIIALMKEDLPTLAAPTTYTSPYWRLRDAQRSTESPSLAIPLPVLAEMRCTSAGSMPPSRSRQACRSHFSTRSRLVPLGSASTLFPTRMSGVSPTSRGSEGSSEPSTSKRSTRYTTTPQPALAGAVTPDGERASWPSRQASSRSSK
mmetsp:Transcript_43095/g.106370  ORF Transcript_43095/g.106370 Transcript_43095/m.106370 type:complete len:421 (-) Transcript_43095:765-2027(-)